ncbi:hypothetical protein MOQ_008347 [Trypanosoma cruzi marinkellei]|uniref:Uncharacterized protein n=1 Tax=Trypanosoma cruzi marinkellei TaxID=85056 RepID=K2ML96_TRYCR|nr:hypothetical protein MOQ_008347 [Trypanosoma cruzi marinkellei]
MENQRLASSILQPLASGPETTTSTASVTRQKRGRASYLYDSNGKRLRGLKGEAAKLMHNHRFFSSEEEIHHLEQALAVGQCSMETSMEAGGSGGGGVGTHKLPTLPDMFGVISPASTAGGGGTVETLNGENVAHGSLVPPMHRWSLVQQRHVTIGSSPKGTDGPDAPSLELRHISTSGYRWARADALLVENALISAMRTEKEEGGEGESEKDGGDSGGDWTCRQGDLPGAWLTHLLSVPPEVELSVFHSSTGPSPFAFLTVSPEEYATLGLGNDMYQPAVLPDEGNDPDTVKWRFDYLSTCKLLELYERFGNFVVVADRWRYSNSREIGVFQSAEGAGATSMETNVPTPPVEVLMERYKLVSEAVLRHRLCLLQEVLKDEDGKDGATAGPSYSCKSKTPTSGLRVKPAEERALPSAHPLTSLMEKHPVLVAQRTRQEWLTQRYRELRQRDGTETAFHEEKENEDELDETDMLSRHRADVMKRFLDLPLPSQEQLSQAACKRNGVESDVSLLVPSFLPPPASPFWYDSLLEQSRRRRLREVLTREAEMNVPYFRALMAERRVSSQATVLFDKLRVLTRDTTTAVQEDEKTCAAEFDESAEKKGKNLERQGLCKKSKQKKQQKMVDAMGEESYQGVQEEVSRIPLQCERLRLCVQAGWFLPPPEGEVGGKSTGSSAAANRALSNFSEALLLSLPPSVPRLHLGVEHELEKHLWEDHRALCDDDAEVQQLLCDARVLYTQNLLLRRFSGRCGVLEASLKKLASEAAAMEMY